MASRLISQLQVTKITRNADGTTSTGFAAGAIEYALSQGIGLRTVTDQTLDCIQDWFEVTELRVLVKGGNLTSGRLLFDEGVLAENGDVLRSLNPNDPILRSTENDENVTVAAAFQAAASQQENLYEDLEPAGGSKPIRLHVEYTNDDSH